MTYPIVTLTAGGIKLWSKEYFTKKEIAKNSANPPIQANNRAPMNISHEKEGAVEWGDRVGIFGSMANVEATASFICLVSIPDADVPTLEGEG